MSVNKFIEKPLYTAGIRLYKAAVALASLKNSKAAKLVKGQKDIFPKIGKNLTPEDKPIWIHAASLGEFEQGRPIIEEIRKRFPDKKILLTFFSPSGYEVRKNYDGADCVCYLPFDTPGNVKRFLDDVNPEMAIFVKYEFWRNYLEELHRREIPVYLISGVFRSSQHFFRKHSHTSEWLGWFTHIFVQDTSSQDLLKGIGIEKTSVTGDTRFDRVANIRENSEHIPEIEEFLNKVANRLMTMVFGSSWGADEDIYSEWLRKHKEVAAVIAPHEFDSERLANIGKLFPNETVLLSEIRENPEKGRGKRIMIIDCFGLLSRAYRYADVAYIGGGFGAGIHNINEAAVYGIPVMFGPHNSKFIEASEMKLLGGGIEVSDRKNFERRADGLLYDKEEREKRGRWAEEYIREKLGATEKTLDFIFGKE